MTQKKKTVWWRTWWPELNTKKHAKDAAKLGAWAAIFSAVATAVIAVVSVYGYSPIAGVDLYALADSVLLLLLAWGIWKMSRIAAVITLAYFILNKILLIPEVGVKNPVILVIFTVMYINGVRGTFAYHKLKS